MYSIACFYCPTLPHRTTTQYSGELLAYDVAGEATHNSHAHQPHGEQQGQVSTVLARQW